MLPRGLAVALLAAACSEPKPAPAACPEVPCDGAADTLLVGRLEGGELVPFGDGTSVTLEFGPQGGQHFRVDLLLRSSRPGRWDYSLSFVEDAGGQQAAQTLVPVRGCPCETLTRDVFVFMHSPDAVTGTLHVAAFRDDGTTLAAPPVRLQVESPL